MKAFNKLKIAVVQGGQLRMDDDILTLSDNLLKDAFPNADFFYPVWREDWNSRREIVESFGGTVEVIDEYEIDYHPYNDNPDAVDTENYKKKLVNPNVYRHTHQTLQILNHNRMMRKYLQDYDVIIRTRYDSIISPVQVFDDAIDMVMSANAVISYQDSGDHFFTANSFIVSKQAKMVSDGGLIFHSPKVWDCDLVTHLDKRKKLLAAEFGWYQVLIGDTDIPYYRFDGGAHMTRCVIGKHRQQIEQLLG